MRNRFGRILALVALAAVTTLVPARALAAGSTGIVDDAGVARCWGAFMTGSAHFVSVKRPIVYAFNQHPNNVDTQRIWTRALLYQWNGSSWQPVYRGSEAVQTPWISEIVSDGQDNSVQLHDYTTHLGMLDISRQGFYRVLFDIRWDASRTVTVSGSRTLWAAHVNDNGGSWVGPADYCDYNERSVPIVFN